VVSWNNDIYEVERPGGQSLGSLSRVAEIRRKLVEHNPRTITILSGDALSPSPLSSAVIEGEELAGRQMVSVLSAMGR
jgi:2',3'-cyclic-nucleotide 2'-phosphodiesterase (5'-nucleotidase family)